MKLRFWQYSTKKFIRANIDSDGRPFLNNGAGGIIDLTGDVGVIQSVEKKDMIKKEIWQGDVYQFQYPKQPTKNMPQRTVKAVIGKDDFNNWGAFGLLPNSDKKDWYHIENIILNGVKVGNIFEHPELND